MATLAPDTAMRMTLIANGTYAAITTRAYPNGMVPQDATLPYSTYFRVSTVRDPVLTRASGMVHARIQWEHYSTSLATVRAMAEAMRSAFDGMIDNTISSGADSLYVLAVRLEDEDDSALAPTSGEELRILGMRQDWIIHYRETVPTFA